MDKKQNRRIDHLIHVSRDKVFERLQKTQSQTMSSHKRN